MALAGRLRTALAASALSGALAACEVGPQATQASSGPKAPVNTGVRLAPPAGAPLSFSPTFEQVAPAVVSIDAAGGRTRTAVVVGPDGALLIPRGPDGRAVRMPEFRSSGSGFFISPDGYIVTNNHVVAEASEIHVTLSDERTLPARLVGRDQPTDLAVLKVDGRDFPYVTFSEQAVPKVGDWVLAVGNPFGLGGSATAGIVSAYGRDIGEAYVDYLQIDAPINQGNSGGPSFDVQGRVIGVNTAIFSPSGGNVGIGFAIPADVASRVTQELISRGRVTRGFVGLALDPRPGAAGALVAEVTPGGPAARAGLRPGDIVTAIEDQPVSDNSDLVRRVGAAQPGQTLSFQIDRGGRRAQLEVRIAERRE